MHCVVAMDRQYDIRIDQLHRKIRIMNEEMVNIRTLHSAQMDVLSQDSRHKSNEIASLKAQLGRLRLHNGDHDRIHENDPFGTSLSSSSQESNHFQHVNQSPESAQTRSRSPSRWEPETEHHSMEDTNAVRLQQMEEELHRFQSEHSGHLREIETLRASLRSKDTETTEMAQEQRERRHKMEVLHRENAELVQQLDAMEIQLEEASILNAKNQMMAKEHRDVQEEQFRLRLQEQKQLSDETIQSLRHEVEQKENLNQRNVNQLMTKMEEMERNHKKQSARLRDEYMSRIRYHRDEMQRYLNTSLRSRSESRGGDHSPLMMDKRRESLNDNIGVDPANGEGKEEEVQQRIRSPMESVSNSMDCDDSFHYEMKSNEMDSMSNGNVHSKKRNVSGNSPSAYRSNPLNAFQSAAAHSTSFSHSANSHESQTSLSHSRDESMYSQISAQSADEIVTSLIVGIDEKLDDLLTPTGNHRNSLKLDAYHKPAITPCTCFP